MPTFRYHKLVRDNIWRWHEEAGHEVTGAQLEGEALRAAMTQKLHEEADEVTSATTRKELVEELADVQQLLDDLCESQGVDAAEVRKLQQQKRQKKGGFLEGYFIETVTMPDEDDKWVQYCREDPLKYPEVQGSTENVDPVLPAIQQGTYIHVKSGKYYEVIDVALHTETNEPLVVYRPLYDSRYAVFVRPYDMFIERVMIDGQTKRRFEKVEDKNT